MKKYLLIAVLFYIPLVVARELTVIKIELPVNQLGHESIVISYNRAQADFATMTFKSKGQEIEANGFYCQKKADEHFCVGDDDGGRFYINDSGVKIDYLNLRYGADEVLEFKGPKRFINFTVLDGNQ